MSKINIKNIILCLVLIIPLKIATHFFLFKDVVASSMKREGGTDGNFRRIYVETPISEWEYHSFEYHFYHTFNHKLWIFPIIIFTMIFILWYFDLYLIKKENPSKNKNITKKPKPKNKEVLKEYYENGKLNYEAEAIDGIKNGYYKDYYESGALKVETTFKDDLMDGECKFYFESGKLSELSHYTAGEPTVGSIVKRYFENGDLQEEVSVSKEGEEFKGTVIKNNLDFLKIDVKAFSESTIKNIDEFDEEKKKQLMEKTIFFDKYGYADKTKGAANTLIEGLEFISRLKGIKEDEFVFDIATFLRMGDDYPPTTDKDGKWYVKFGNTLVKYFSDKKFKTALKDLLKANNIEEKIVTCECSEDCYCSRKVRIDMRLGVVTQIFVGDGFEICYVIGAYNGKDVSEFIVKNPDVPIFIPKNKDGLRDYKVINFPGEFESYAKKLYDVYNEEDSKIINIRNTAEQDKQSLSYIHIEGKGLYNL